MATEPDHSACRAAYSALYECAVEIMDNPPSIGTARELFDHRLGTFGHAYQAMAYAELYAELDTAHDALREIGEADSLGLVKAICANGPLGTAPGGPREDECFRLRAELEASRAERDRAVEARENANAATLRVEHEVERLGALARERDGFLHAIGKVIARHEASLDRDFDASTRDANDG